MSRFIVALMFALVIACEQQPTQPQSAPRPPHPSRCEDEVIDTAAWNGRSYYSCSHADHIMTVQVPLIICRCNLVSKVMP